MTYRSLSLSNLLRGCAAAVLAIGLSACAALPATGADAWTEEVLLHDGQKIMLDRSQTYRGNTEPGQHPPVGAQTLRFSPPGGRGALVWSSDFSSDIGRTDFNPLAIHVKDGVAYVITEPNLCLSYNKWGRPNPPYVVFRQSGQDWQRIAMAELPIEFTTINLLINDNQWEIKERSKDKGYLSAKDVDSMNAVLRMPELKTVLRAAINYDPECIPMVTNGKGLWLARGWFTKEPTLEACLAVCKREKFDDKTCPCNKIFEGKQK